MRGGYDPATEPVTTRVAAGRSPLLTAAAALSVLFAVVLVAVAGRLAAPGSPSQRFSAPGSPPRAADAGRDATATLDPAVASPAATTGPTATPRPPAALLISQRDRHPTQVGLNEDAYGVLVVVGPRLYFDVLDETAPGLLSGSFWLTLPEDGAEAHIELAQLWSRERTRRNYSTIGSWTLELDKGLGEPGLVLLDIERPPRDLRRAPRLVRTGFGLTVRAGSHERFDVLEFLVRGPR